MIFFAVVVLTIAFAFRYQLANGFTVLLSNRYDGSIEISILEHWYNALRGFEPWNTTSYFYPYRSTLAYNDGYFLYGLIYSAFRAGGVDPYLASEIVNILIRAIGFIVFFLMLRRVFSLAFGWALFGSVLFTVSTNIAIHAAHEQLLTVTFAPLLAVLVRESLVALRQGSRGRFLALSVTVVAFQCAWLMTAFYMAWFTLYFCLFLVPVIFCLTPRDESRELMRSLRQQWMIALLLVPAFGLALWPFLALYLPKARSTGMWDFTVVSSYALDPLEILHVGRESWVWGGLDTKLWPGLAFGEHTVGIPPLILIVFLVGVGVAWRNFKRRAAGSAGLVAATTAAVLMSWVFIFRFGNFLPWRLIFEIVPGAKALRVIARYQIFLTVPVTAIVVVTLSGLRRYVAKAPLLLLCAALITEEATGYQAEGQLMLMRPWETEILWSVPPPPPECRVFFVSEPRAPLFFENPATNAIYSQNVDAMLLSELLHIPTINGESTFAPPDSHFADTDHAAYLRQVDDYASRHKIANLCALDLRKFAWSAAPAS